MKKIISILILALSIMLFSCSSETTKEADHGTEQQDNHTGLDHADSETAEHTCSGKCTTGTHKCGDHCGCGDTCGCTEESSCSGECKVKS